MVWCPTWYGDALIANKPTVPCILYRPFEVADNCSVFSDKKQVTLKNEIEGLTSLVNLSRERLERARENNAHSKRKSEIVPTIGLERRLSKAERDLQDAIDRNRIYDNHDYSYTTQQNVARVPKQQTFEVAHADIRSNLCTWTPWCEHALLVPFVSSKEGIGNGERRVAKTFGGVTLGPTATYDVLLSDGSKWEVKQVTKSSMTIRASATGADVLSEARAKIDDTMRRMSSLIEASVLCCPDVLCDPRMSFLQEFVKHEFDMIVKCCEISTKRFSLYKKAMNVASDILNSHRASIDGITGFELVHGDTQVAVEDHVARQILGSMVSSAPMSVCHLDAFALLLSRFIDVDPFKDVATYISSLKSCLLASRVFEHVDGIVLVNEALGCRVIDKQSLDDELELHNISQARLKYLYTGSM